MVSVIPVHPLHQTKPIGLAFIRQHRNNEPWINKIRFLLHKAKTALSQKCPNLKQNVPKSTYLQKVKHSHNRVAKKRKSSLIQALFLIGGEQGIFVAVASSFGEMSKQSAGLFFCRFLPRCTRCSLQFLVRIPFCFGQKKEKHPQDTLDKEGVLKLCKQPNDLIVG